MSEAVKTVMNHVKRTTLKCWLPFCGMVDSTRGLFQGTYARRLGNGKGSRYSTRFV